MNYISIFIIFMLVSVNGRAMSFNKYTQDVHFGEHRVILLYATPNASNLFNRQLTELKSHKEGIIERDIVMYIVVPKDDSDIISEYKLDKDPFTIILLAKDGTVTHRSNELITAQDLFSMIDTTTPIR